jgi:hypothetical protein
MRLLAYKPSISDAFQLRVGEELVSKLTISVVDFFASRKRIG